MMAATQFSLLVLLIAAMVSSTAAMTPTASTAVTTTPAATTTAASITTAAAAASSTAAASGTTAAPPAGSSAAPGSTAAPGTGPTTAGAPAGSTAAPTTQSPIIACLHCNGTGDSNDPCPDATSSFATTLNCDTQEGCWVYREENSTGHFTISRGCGRDDLNDGECTEQKQSEQCEDANNNSVCRRCCTTASCNHAGLTLTGSVGTPTAYVSTVVIVTSFIMAVFSNNLRF